jgi:hypothetical protein
MIINDGHPSFQLIRLTATMKRLVSLLLFTLLSILTVARAMKPSHTLSTIAKTAQEKSTERKADDQDFAGGRKQGGGCDD